MEDFKAANRTFGGEWKLERKGVYSLSSSPSTSPSPSSSSPNQLSSTDRSGSDPPPPPPPPAAALPTIRVTTYEHKNRYNTKNYNHYSSHNTWSVSNSELKRQRRVMRYKSYAVETKLKYSLVHGFRWMKTKYSQFVRGY
ncbi:hypothetical protein CCACVL1_28540 [Corchorus capsularis]|uniref:Uncharacterized protein n=1 Tax=Corchorus capsularis TaxID=210143 RepID=A0A1R3G6B3_COCAP|nr:hypothetical protein CCACVL1_28540 [Corchorus capsularis]